MKKMLFLIPMALLVSCSPDPIPAEKSDYIGLWKGETILLEILEDGNMSYAKIMEDFSETVDAPIKEFDGDSFVAGYWFLTETFEVTLPPTEEDGVWKMVVNGEEVIRQ